MTRPTRLILLGSPVAHSLSPLFQNAALESAALPLRYEALDVAPGDLDRVITDLAAHGAAGNVTVPHKEAVFARCDHRSPLAARVGAVNCFWSVNGSLEGDNTDVGGFRHAATLLCGEALPRTITIVGAGGSAAAVCAAAEEWGATEVRLRARSMERASALADRFPRIARPFADTDSALDGCELVVNTTPLGLRDGDALPVAVERVPRGAAVIDLAYRAGETALVRAARTAGHRAADGLAMLLEQGALSFERWFGIVPDREAMARALRAAVGRDR